MDLATEAAVQDFILTWNLTNEEERFVELARYRVYVNQLKTNNPTYWKYLLERKISIFEFWNGLSKFPLLQEIALVVFSLAVSSSSSERNFSAQGYIQSKLRNRLNADRLEKLVHIFCNLKNYDEEDMNYFELIEDMQIHTV